MKTHDLVRVMSTGGLLMTCLAAGPLYAADLGRVPKHHVLEIAFDGPQQGPTDAPAREVEFSVVFRHQESKTEVRLPGFWDGDGKGGVRGNVFKVRFSPASPGQWRIVTTVSSHDELKAQREGDTLECVESSHPGRWLPEGRWYKRCDGSHPYIFGNTHYTFLSRRNDRGPNDSTIDADVRGNAEYFKKLRFGLFGGRYVHPTDKPFLDDQGRPTDDGNFSHRPNPKWFHQRADLAVQTAWELDLIADLILNGPDTSDARSVLQAGNNGGDNGPFLRYVAARYGSYPNVWFCLANEWNIKDPKYTAEQIAKAGATLRRVLAYPVPISVHASPGDWKAELNTSPPWNDHVILQGKIRTLADSADLISRQRRTAAGRPVINDELGYQGGGDRFSRDDVIEGHLGAFLGGGYGTTGFKPANKKGHYFWGAFKAEEHTAAAHLAWLRSMIDKHVTFWKMQPVAIDRTIFTGAGEDSRAMEWAGNEYVLGTNSQCRALRARLPKGKWRIRCFDAVAMKELLLAEAAEGTFSFSAPESRAVLFHFQRTDGPAAVAVPE